MKIEKTLNGKDMTVRLEGYLNTETSPELKQFLLETMDSIDTLTFDLKDLDYISSAGLRVLIKAHIKMDRKGGMKILHPNETVLHALNMTGLKDWLVVEKE